jgi:hypothetical protein
MTAMGVVLIVDEQVVAETPTLDAAATRLGI